MIYIRSLRFRLAVWYFCTVAVICALAGIGYWFSVRSGLNHALDQGLRYRLIGLREFLQDVEPGGAAELASRLDEVSRLGDLHQVFDANGRLIARSDGLARHGVIDRPPQGLAFEIRYATGGTPDFPLRLAWQKVTIGTHTLILGAADPQRKFEGVLGAFTTVLLLSMPVILALATGCGVWLGRRALAPVARITDGARAITESNLSARLAVPDSRDELQQLSETLNDMLERIEQAFLRTRQFTADASHELRAPMTLIYTAAQHSLRRDRSREDLVDSMQKILRESQRTTALIDDLLLLARGDAGKEPAALEPIDAGPLLRDAAEQAAAMAAAKKISVTLQLEAEVLPINANGAQLRRLLLILIDNALKYTPPGGQVAIQGSVNPGNVTISVADSGPGIAPDDLPHVFERFWRADKVRSRDAGGTGLGLTIAKQIAELHGAHLGVQSEVGRGSILTIRLPVVTLPGEERQDDGRPDCATGDHMRRNALHLLLALGMASSMAVGYASDQPVPAAGSSSVGAAAGNGANDPLLFPKDAYTEETRTVRTSLGEKKVTVHSYKHIPYVANPVDKDYQSLDVTVPVRVDGRTVDASNAPMLFAIGVGGYMSVNNAGRGDLGGRIGGPRDGRIGGPPAGRGIGGPGGAGGVSRNTDLALAAGYVVVSPGCRGRDNRAADGTYYGKAPAAIVDLKAAVRYVRHNAGVMPGNVTWIITTGVSAGGALSALLGASGNSRLYDAYLNEIGAADAEDAVLASADFSPIMDLDHADMAYEWMYGTVPARSGFVDQDLSRQLKDAFAVYQASLKLQGQDGFGMLTADTCAAYLLRTYLIPSANRYLRDLTEEQRTAYLAKNPWLAWTEKGAAFAFTDYLAHVGRMKGLPAFDDFEMRQPEPNEFGNKTTDSRHFTNFSLRHATGNPNAAIDHDLQTVVNLMNPMYFIGQNNVGMAGHWWIRTGTSDAHTSLTVVGNLAASLENRHKHVNARLYWDAGHGADEDAESLIAWIGKITGYKGGN